MDTTETLATFITSFDGAKIPEPVRAIAVRSLVNWAGCAAGIRGFRAPFAPAAPHHTASQPLRLRAVRRAII